MIDRNNLSGKILEWILSMFGLVLATLVLGSYGFTWIVDMNQTKEKQEWRQQHNEFHKQELAEVKREMKESVESVKKELKENQNEIKELLEKIIRVQERVNMKERRNP